MVRRARSLPGVHMGDSVRRIAGYEVVEKLGAGTVGTVYKARQVAMDRLPAR